MPVSSERYYSTMDKLYCIVNKLENESIDYKWGPKDHDEMGPDSSVSISCDKKSGSMKPK